MEALLTKSVLLDKGRFVSIGNDADVIREWRV